MQEAETQREGTIQEDGPWEVLYSSWLRDDSELRLYKYQNSHIENQTLFTRSSEQECSSPRTSRGDLRKLQKQSQRSTVKLYLTGRQSGRRRRARFSPVLSTHKAVSLLIFASVLPTNVKKLQFFHSAAPPPRRPFILQKQWLWRYNFLSSNLLISRLLHTFPHHRGHVPPVSGPPKESTSTCLRRSLPSQPYTGQGQVSQSDSDGFRWE